MNRSKATKATKVIHQMADYVERSGITVTWSGIMSIVSIDAEDGQNAFMQGEEAADFIKEVRQLCRKYRSLDEYTAALCLANPYVDCLFT